MGSLEFQWDKEDLRSKLENKLNELPSRTITLVEDISDVVEAYMRDESPVRFGDLQNSHTTEVLSDLERWIGPTVAHAEFVIKGTRPHVIEAKNAQALGPFSFGSYMGVKTGGYVKPTQKSSSFSGLQFFKSVQHPGTQPNDYITRARERSEGRSSELIHDFMGWLTE